MRYAFVVDSNNQLTENVLKEYEIDQIPTPCSIGEDLYYDETTITAPEFLEKMVNSKEQPRTSAIEPGMLEESYRKRMDEGGVVMSMHMSGNLSKATFEVIAQVKEKFPSDRIFVHDSMQVCGGCGVQYNLIARKAREEQDIRPDDLLAYAAEIRKRTVMLACCPDLNYLYRGGRIGRAKSLMGALLNIMPIIQMRGEDNIISACGKGRNYKQVNKLMVESLRMDMEKHGGRKAVFIVAAMPDNIEAGEDLKEQLSASGLPLEEIPARMNVCQVVYLGPKAWDLAYSII